MLFFVLHGRDYVVIVVQCPLLINLLIIKIYFAFFSKFFVHFFGDDLFGDFRFGCHNNKNQFNSIQETENNQEVIENVFEESKQREDISVKFIVQDLNSYAGNGFI